VLGVRGINLLGLANYLHLILLKKIIILRPFFFFFLAKDAASSMKHGMEASADWNEKEVES